MAKVLLVEDDNNLREIYEARLTAEGYDIATAQNGEEALSVAKQEKPDLIISDVMMPRISGFEMLDILRNTDELKNTKVIMLTALGQAEDRGRADNLGADKYLVKSQVTLEDIVNAAKSLLSDEEPGSIAAPAAEEPIVLPEPAAPEPAAAAVPAPEPATTPVAVDPVAPAPVAAEPVAAPAAIPEPVSVPVTPVPEPVAAPEPATAVAPAPEPVAPVVPAATVTVVDPDPIAPVTAPVVAEPATPPPVVPVPVDGPAPEAALDSQTLADEEAAIEAQIASFATTSEPVPTPVAPVASPTVPPVAPEVAATTAANDAVMEDAIDKLTSPEAAEVVTAEPAAAAPVAEEPAAVAPEPEPVTDNVSQISGHKVIQPIGDVESSTPDLQALLAAEEAKEAAATPAPATPVVNGTPAPAAAPTQTPPATPGVDPNTIAL